MLALMALESKSPALKFLMARTAALATVLLALLIVAPNAALAEWKLVNLTKPGSVKNSAELRPAVSCVGLSCKISDKRPFASEGAPAPDGLPDGKIATSSHYKNITGTWYTLPTRRYDHGILGDKLEAGGFAVKTRAGKVITYQLPESEVFEDRTPRLADLDGDGTAEIVTILTSLTDGGSLAVFSLKDGKLVKTAQTAMFGQPYRWLNIAGFADFNGDGKLDIAGVWTPHIGGTLRFWTLSNGQLKQIGTIDGFSNHFIGSYEQRLSAIGDLDGNGTPDLILPSAGRDVLRMIGFEKGQLVELGSIKMPTQIDKAIAISGSGKQTVLTLGLKDGSTWAAYR